MAGRRRLDYDWFHDVPAFLPYPWLELNIPLAPTPSEAEKLANHIKEAGNKSFKRGDYYDALWKYEHARGVLNSFNHFLESGIPVLLCNIAACCLKLGDEGRKDLLHGPLMDAKFIEKAWYFHCSEAATQVISMQPDGDVAYKAHWRRGESAKKIFCSHEMMESLAKMMHLFPGGQHPVEVMVIDYVRCFELQESPEAKVLMEAISLAVEHDHIRLLPVLTAKHVRCGLTTTILKEMLDSPNFTSEHINCLLLEMTIDSSVSPHFDVDGMNTVSLLKKKVFSLEAHQKMVRCGMVVTAATVEFAVQCLGKTKTDLFKFLVDVCPTKSNLVKIGDLAVSLRKKYFLDVLKEVSESSFDKLRESGNILFQKGQYAEALSKYFQAINYCKKRNMKSEMALIRANCAQACLKLELYSDAHTHSCECIKLDPQNHKGYFRRAEALRMMLETSSNATGGTHIDLVKDYLKCHSFQTNVDAFCKAVVVAVEQKCTRLIPKLRQQQVESGFSNQVLQYFIDKVSLTEPLLEFVCLKLADVQLSMPYETYFISLKKILRVTTKPQIVSCMIAWGIMVLEEDVIAAGVHIPNDRAMLIDLILSHFKVLSDERYQAVVNVACFEAMKDKRTRCVAAFIRQGATPDPRELLQLPGIMNESVIRQYYSVLSSVHDTAEVVDDMTGPQDSDTTKLKKHVQVLNGKAKDCFKANQMSEALQYYKQALGLCHGANLHHEASSLHSNLAHLFLILKDYKSAYDQANNCLQISKDNAKAYFRRGEALRNGIKKGEVDVKRPGSLSHVDALSDYKKSFKFKKDMKVLVEGVLFASEYDQADLFFGECSGLAEDACLQLLNEVMNSKSCRSETLAFLVKVWKTKKLDCSGINLKILITEKKVSDSNILSWFIGNGCIVGSSDVFLAIQCLADKKSSEFKLLLRNCDHADKDQLCQEALKANKMTFLCHLLNEGAALPNDYELVINRLLVSKNFTGVETVIKLLDRESFEKMDLSSLLTNNLYNQHKLIKMFIEAGVSPNGKKSPIVTVMGMNHLKPEVQVELVCVLLRYGANCSQLSQASRVNSTPLHVATELSLKVQGNTEIIDVVAPLLSDIENEKFTNEKGETPLHLAVKSHLKRDVSIKVLSALLSKDLISPDQRDKSNKKPSDYLKPGDPRFTKLQEHIKSISKPKKKQKKKKKVNGNKGTSKESKKVEIVINDSESQEMVDELSDMKATSPQPAPMKQTMYENRSVNEKITYHLEKIFNKSSELFLQEEPVNIIQDQGLADQPSHLQVTSPTYLPFDKPKTRSPIRSPARSPSHVGSLQGSTHSSPRSESTSITSTESSSFTLSELRPDMEGLPDFDDLPWEVEITRNVVKFFKNTKKHSPVDRLRAANVIYQIAEGKRNEHLCKIVSNSPDVCIFEARITKSGRVLWEKAITYSSKLTGESECAVYTQVIRVWEVILDHDELDNKISYCVEQVVNSYKRGYMATIRWSLKLLNIGQETGQVRGQDVHDFPNTYVIQSQDAMVSSKYHFVPAASTKDTEYNVTTFYSFDGMTVRSMIAGSNDKRDYPFKEWQKEHEIIKLKSSEAILLLGRSGTGKTTCCLYRLWNEFKNHWDPTSLTFGVKIPRKALISSSSLTSDEDDTESEIIDEVELNQEEMHSEVSNMDQEGLQNTNDQESDSEYDNAIMIEEDLHQVFVTKNYVLCDQMKKRFYSMVAAYDFLESHLLYEEVAVPNSFDKFENLSFPAFLTARQFYILLDNSLEDGKKFFKRDVDGNLQVKISSLDYDHEDQDLLLDFVPSDTDDEELEVMNSSLDQPMAKQQRTEKWTEVTALYFKEIVWPKISHQCKVDQDVDPMLVWLEIQSFIKGSELAVVKGAPLNFDEYKVIGNRMAPNFSDHREMIYRLYRYYQAYVKTQRYKCFLFDECDLILNLYQRLNEIEDVNWSVHSIYIDEVQDFTQAELSIFIHCCRDPNSMFFTGDTAQSIMRGISFRFQDLRSCYHRLNRHIPSISVPQKPFNLVVNYRSHSGILKLAGTIIDLMKEFFQDSIDHLPDDEGMFPGPVPVFMDSCEEEDLSLLLSTNKRECSAIEFGAHQVILVQSKKAKDKLPQILKGAIVLTIFEAKGLEFDDVLLYNFFSDSMVDERVWRVIASYLEMPAHLKKIESEDPLPGCSSRARSKVFDALQHKSLNAELKYLYTAITRAKCNLWIYDSDSKARLPMLEYWHKRNAVKIVSADGGSVDQTYSIVFASNSTPDQWKAQGDNFRKKHLWEQAVVCYERAGSDYVHLVKEAQAYHLIQMARQQKPALFYEAALRFLECSSLRFSLQYLTGAALCLKNSRPPRYIQAAKLFEKLGDAEKSAQMYLKAKDYSSFVRVQESREEYDSVIRSLLGKPFMRKRDALAKADEYEKKGHSIDPKYTTSELSFSCAKFYSERKDNQTLLEVLKYMPEQDKKVKFMKEAELYKEAYEEYIKNKEFAGAFHLALAQGWFDKGIVLSEKENDIPYLAKFVALEAKLYFHDPGSYQKEKTFDEVLSKLRKLTSSKNELIKAEANLIVSLNKDKSSCIRAIQLFKMKGHKAGILESFERLAEASDQEVLNSCHVAKKLSKTLREAKDISNDLQQTMKFYGFQLLGKAYVTSSYGHYFVTFDKIQKYKCEDSQYDIDGMVRIKREVTELFAAHCGHYCKSWIARYKLESKLYTNTRKFALHTDLWKNRHLTRQYSPQEISAEALHNYIQNCVYVLELKLLLDEVVDGTLNHFGVIFSPEISLNILSLGERHVKDIRKATNSLPKFKAKVEKDLKQLCEEKQSEFEDESEKLLIDSWLSVWRLCSLSHPSMKPILAKLDQIEESVRKESTGDPLGYIFWKTDKQHRHIFRFWLNSCNEIRENGKALWSSKLAITHFLGNAVENKRITISILNIVNVLTIHTTALLAMMTHSNALRNYPPKFTVPHLYKHVVEVFNCMNCRQASDSTLLAACVKEVTSNRNNRFFSECRSLLNTALNYLVGGHERAKKYSVLRFGLLKFPYKGQTLLCVILTLTIFGNLSLIQNVKKYEDKIIGIFDTVTKNTKLPDCIERIPIVYSMLAQKIRHRSEVVLNPEVVFELVNGLLTASKKDGTISRIIFKQKHDSVGHIEIQPLVSRSKKTAQVNKSSIHASHGVVPPSPAVVNTLPHINVPSLSSPFSGVDPVHLPAMSTSSNHPGSAVSVSDVRMPVSSIPIHSLPHNMSTPGSDSTDSKKVTFNSGDVIYSQKYTPIGTRESLPSPTTEFPTHHLSASAKQFVPNIPLPEAVMDSPLEHTGFLSPGISYSGSYFEESDMLSQAHVDDDFPIVEDTIEEYMLAQPPQPHDSIDSFLITDEIVDKEDQFCIACGIRYREDDHLEYDLEAESLVSYQLHFSGLSHREKAVAFTSYLAEKRVCAEYYHNVEEKLKECEELSSGTDLLDHSIENFKDEMSKYDLTTTDVQESRKWGDGIKKINRSTDTFKRLLKEAQEQLRKADLAKLKEEEMKKKRMMRELEEDQEEMEKMSNVYANDVVDSTDKSQKLRTEEEKLYNRTKKKGKMKKAK